MGLPVLKGGLRLEQGNTFVWEGQWAMSDAAYASGQVSEFRYHFKSKTAATADPPASVSDASSVVEHARGAFTGYFMLNDAGGKKAKVTERRVVFDFSKQEAGPMKVYAVGKNGYGTFAMRGTYNPETGDLHVTKSYEPVTIPSSARKVTGGKRKATPARFVSARNLYALCVCWWSPTLVSRFSRN